MPSGPQWKRSVKNMMPLVKYNKTHVYKPAKFRYDDGDSRHVSTAPERPNPQTAP